MEKVQEHVPSTDSSVRILSTNKDSLSLQYIVELPNRKRNIISFRVCLVFAALLSLIWFRRIAIIVVSASVLLMLYYELSRVCKETVTVIKDTCVTYSATTLLGRKKFQSVPISRLLAVTLIENIVGSRVHGILNLIVRTGERKSIQIPLFTVLRPNLETITRIRNGIISYTDDAIKKNVSLFGKENIMLSVNMYDKNHEHLSKAFKDMKNKKGA